jgi:hypothetical protein
MNPADGEAARLVPTERPSAGAAAGSGEESDQQLRTILENLGRVAHQDEHYSGFTPYLDQEASERKALYDRLGAIEGEMKRRRSGGFVRYLVAILIGVAATLAWQSYGEAAKQIIATRAPELGWSPEAKQMIASWTLGWTKPPASPEKIAPETVAPKAPPAPSIDPAQVQQMVQSLATVRETVQEVAARQEQTARDIASLESAVAEILLKTPGPPPQPPAAPARKPTPTTPSSRAPIAPRLPPHP